MDIPIQIVNGTKITIQFSGSSDEIGIQFLMTIFSVLAGFLIALFSIWITERYRRKQGVRQSTQSILNELDIHEKFLRERKKPFLSLVPNPKTHEESFAYNGSLMQRSAFESALYSGSFRHFSLELQKQISNLYVEIELTNHLSGKILEFITMGDMNSVHFKRSMIHYGDVLDSKLDQILDTIISLRKLLK